MTKVCHLTSAHPDDDIRIFQKECRSLAKAGYDVHLIAPGEGDTIVRDNVTIHHVKKNIRGRLSRMTVTVNEVYKLAQEVNADIYHFHDPELMRIGVKLKKLGKKVIYDVHEDLPRQMEDKEYIDKNIRGILSRSIELYENSVAKKMDYIITATPHISERFAKINAKVNTINNYPFTHELATESSWDKKQNQVCYIGGLTEIRGIYQLVQAMKNVDNVKLVLAGSFSGEGFEERVKSSQGWLKVDYRGQVNREELKQILAKSKAGVVTFLPVANHIHAQPNKMFEYMSAGIPVIASDFPLWREIIAKNECGYLADPDDPEAIAKAIKNIFTDDSLAEKMGKNGRKAVLEKYNWETEEAKLIRIYKELEDK